MDNTSTSVISPSNEEMDKVSIQIAHYKYITQLSQKHINSLQQRIESENTNLCHSYNQSMIVLLTKQLERAYEIYQNELNQLQLLQERQKLQLRLISLENQLKSRNNLTCNVNNLDNNDEHKFHESQSMANDHESNYEVKQECMNTGFVPNLFSTPNRNNNASRSKSKSKPKMNAFADTPPVEPPQEDQETILASNPYSFAPTPSPERYSFSAASSDINSNPAPFQTPARSSIPFMNMTPQSVTNRSPAQKSRAPEMITPNTGSIWGGSPKRTSRKPTSRDASHTPKQLKFDPEQDENQKEDEEEAQWEFECDAEVPYPDETELEQEYSIQYETVHMERKLSAKRTMEPNIDQNLRQFGRAKTETDESGTASERIDNALGQYYESMGRTDYYEDDDREQGGIFLKWFQENGYEEDGLEDELGNDAEYTDCNLIEFTELEDFPLNQDGIAGDLNDDQRQLEIFKVLQHCYNFGFDARIKYGYDPLHDMTTTKLFPTVYIDENGRERPIDFELIEMDKQKTTQIYQNQCEAVFGKKIQTDDEFEYGLAVGVKNDNFPFMQYIIDIYMRYCLQYVLSDIKHRTLKDHPFDKFFRDHAIKFGVDQRVIDNVIGAIDIYLRLCPQMHVTKPLTVINDDIKWIIEYIVIANHIIDDILENNPVTPEPFQLDLIIACNSVECTQTMCHPEFSNEDLKDDDDDDDESDEDDYDDQAFQHLNQDVLGDVHHKLNQNKLRNINIYTEAIRKPDDMNVLEFIDDLEKTKLIKLCRKMMLNMEVERGEIVTHKPFACVMNLEETKQESAAGSKSNWYELCDIYGKLRALKLRDILDEICGKDLNVGDVILFEIIDYELDFNGIKKDISRMLDKNMNMDHFEYNKKSILDGYHQFAQQFSRDNDGENDGSYPFKERMCMFVDRRSNNFEQKEKNKNNKHSYCDDIIFYEYPSGANKLPWIESNKILPEAFHNLSQKCMIPRIGYKDGENEAMLTMNMKPMDRMRKSTITCRTAPGGNVLIFSFHVIKKEIIKCYLWRDSQFTRFFNGDIVNILPFIFSKGFGNNDKFMNKEINGDKLYSYIHSLTFEDKLFNGWYNNRSK